MTQHGALIETAAASTGKLEYRMININGKYVSVHLTHVLIQRSALALALL